MRKDINSTENNSYFSNKAIWVSFVMSVLVVYIHANNLKNVGLEEVKTSTDWILTQIMARGFGDMAVPFFFVLAGFFFFRFDIWSGSVFSIIEEKLKRRVKSLVVPYLIWNTFGTVFYMLIKRVPAIVAVMNSKEVIDFTIPNVLRGVFLYEYYYSFWYMHDLIVLALLSPVIILILRNQKRSILLLCLLGFATLFPDRYIIRAESMFYFLLGGYISCYQREKFEERSDQKQAILSVVVILVVVVIRFLEIPYLSRIALLFAPLALWKAFDLFPIPSIKWFYTQSFFVYASHSIPVTVVMKILARTAPKGTEALSYMITPWITLGLLYIIAKTLNSWFPRFYKILCGGR